jgi:hypothetical protein
MTHSHGKKRPEGESRSSDGDKSDSFADSDYQLVPQDSLYLRRKNRWSGFVLPPFFFPMSQEQLVAGVKVIYDALMIVEAICNTQTASQSKDKLEAFFELHRKLTYGHDDFLEVTQDSSADPTLRALAAKSLMLAQSVNLLYVHYGLIVTQQRSPTHLASIMQRIRFLTGNSRSASSESPTRSTTEPTISGSLQGINISAFPDTGANANFISERYAQHYGFPIDNSAKSHATVGNGASVSIIGTTTLSFHFAKESTTHLLTFNVLRESIHDVILGSPFLRVTETLTRFTARIGQKIRDSVDDNFFKMCLLGSSNMYVRGLVNGTPVSAVPDTGAEVSVMSASFARENGFHVNSDERHRVPFGFADGSTAEALGVIRDATWNYGRDKKAHLTNFYVLEDLPVDVVLGNDFLCRTNAFVEHEDDFWHVETATSKDGFALNLIRVLEPCADAQPCEYRLLICGTCPKLMGRVADHTGTNASANTNLEGRRAEALAAYRRAKQEAQDQNLTGDEKTRYLEPFLTTWQRLWEINPGLATPAGSATSVSPSNNISTSSSQVNGTQNHNGLQQQAPDPGIDSSSPLSKSRVNWLKRAVGWRSRRCVVAV